MQKTTRLAFFTLLMTTMLVSCSGIGSLFATPTPTLTPTPTPVPFLFYGKSLLDATYCTMDGQPQKLDVYFPASGGPWPMVVYVHGGSWMNGDKAEAKGLADWLNPLGYAVASLNYRMYPSVRFPALIEDPKCGIRFLRAHAAEYNLDPEHFAAFGASAGWEVGEYIDESSRVQAVVDMSGPSDLTVMYPNDGLATVIMMAFGIKPEQRAVGSPITYATADDPPFLIIHGDKDPTVPVEQGQLMYAALIKAGVSARLVIVKNGLHDLTAAGAAPTTPTRAEVDQMVLDFLAETLKGEPVKQ